MEETDNMPHLTIAALLALTFVYLFAIAGNFFVTAFIIALITTIFW
jgi:hypothetical protein